MPHLIAPFMQTSTSTLGCSRQGPGACWGLLLALPSHGTMAQPCLPLPAAKPQTSYLENTQLQAEEGKDEHGEALGLVAAPRGHRHLLLSIPSTTHPSPASPWPPSPPGQALRWPRSGTQRSRP